MKTWMETCGLDPALDAERSGDLEGHDPSYSFLVIAPSYQLYCKLRVSPSSSMSSMSRCRMPSSVASSLDELFCRQMRCERFGSRFRMRTQSGVLPPFYSVAGSPGSPGSPGKFPLIITIILMTTITSNE